MPREAETAGNRIGTLPPYPSTRDPGLPWLGHIPAHWKVKRLKHIVFLNSETLPETTNPDYVIQYLDIGNVDEIEGIGDIQEFRFENAPSRARRIVRDGDMIISTVRTYLKAVAFIEKPAANQIVSTGFAVLRPKPKTHPKYLSWLVQSKPFVERVVAHSVGVGYPAINPSELAILPVWLPPLPEQRTIAAFLDRQTAKIDALIAKKQRLLELLQEKRAALISQAVTKGLPSPSRRGAGGEVRMKDSGVAWLGQVPENWEVKQVKRVFSVANGSTPSSGVPEYWDGDIVWVTPEDLGRLQSDTLFESRRRITKDGYKNCGTTLVPAGSLVLSTRAPIGHLAIAGVKLCTNQGCRSLVFRSKNDVGYFYYLILAAHSELQSRGTGTTFSELGKSELESVEILVPPLPEQTAIAAYLDYQTKRLTDLATKVETAIERLREYRSALISSAVTGKIKVEG